MYESKFLSKAKWLLIPLMFLLMVISMFSMMTPAKAAETNADTSVNLRDKVTENYIKEHIDNKYTSADKTELKNLILVKQTLFDGNKLKANENLDILYYPFDNFDKILGQFMSNVPVYNLSDNSEYYVAYINTMQNNKQATIRDYDFAKNNTKGELIEGCILDKETGLAYIPKKLFASEKAGKEELCSLQVQLMQVMGGNTDDISLQTCSATQSEDQSVKNGETTFGDIYDTTTTAVVEKGLDINHIAVYVNGLITPPSAYQYDAESGKITVMSSPASINTITVEKTNEDEKAVVNQLFGDVDLKTQTSIDIDTPVNPDDLDNTHTNSLKIPKDTKVGDYIDGSSTYYYKGFKYDGADRPHVNNTDPEITQAIYNMHLNGTLHLPYFFRNISDEAYANGEKLVKWVNDGTSFKFEDKEGLGVGLPDEMDSIDELERWGAVFFADFADGKANFKFSNGKTFDASPLEQLNLACIHLENPAESINSLNNGEIYPGTPDATKYDGYPMRMRFYKITDDYAIIGIIAARCHTIDGGPSEFGQASEQAGYGLFKIPIQKENLRLNIEKDDESGAKLAGAVMELHKDTATGELVAPEWDTSESNSNPKAFENIEAGKYVLVEKNAPEGYEKVEPIEFTLNDDNTVTITKDPSGKATVEQGEGTATIKVADPKEPDPTGTKTETDPGDGKPVKIGQEITYEITTKNEYSRNADIVITDPLDQGLDFVTADNDGKYDENTRTVTWSFKGVEPGKTVKVTFKAKVNEKAVIKVVNKAKIIYDNKHEIETPQVENPIPEPPVKTEPKPGENEPVAVGDEVTYEVTQKNYKDAPADIVFTDHLDKRVDFVSADNDGSYDANTHTITWTIKDVPSGETAKVGFVVKVNDKATEIIENQAIAKVGDDPEQETNIIKNPLKTPVVKTEITPGEGKQVKVGDEVTYKVHFRNYRFTPETVVVTDRLDPGVDFVSADNNGTYDQANHMIVWTFKDMEARKEQDVTFKVKVNSKAGTVIRNQAEVQVGNDPVQKTNIIENPLAPGTAKTGVEGNNNTLIFVIIGILCVAALGCGIYFFNKKQKENTVTEDKTVKKDINAKDKKDVK